MKNMNKIALTVPALVLAVFVASFAIVYADVDSDDDMRRGMMNSMMNRGSMMDMDSDGDMDMMSDDDEYDMDDDIDNDDIDNDDRDHDEYTYRERSDKPMDGMYSGDDGVRFFSGMRSKMKDHFEAEAKRGETEAEIKISVMDNGEFAYKFEVENIENMTAAHLHLGKSGETGPAVLTILSGENITVTGERDYETMSKFSVNDLNGVQDADEFINLMRDGKIYLNVHTQKNPAGEVRGQIFEKDYRKRMMRKEDHQNGFMNEEEDRREDDDRDIARKSQRVMQNGDIEEKRELIRELREMLLQLLQSLLQQLKLNA